MSEHYKWHILSTDFLLYILLFLILLFILWARRQQHFKNAWRHVCQSKIALVSLVIIVCYLFIGLLDSIHFQKSVSKGTNGETYYSTHVISVLDLGLNFLHAHSEKTYSAPFALHAYTKEVVRNEIGHESMIRPRLQHAGIGVDSHMEQIKNILSLLVIGTSIGLGISALLILLCKLTHYNINLTVCITLVCVIVLSSMSLTLAQNYHIFGTDKVGQDVFYEALKSIRTGIIIGSLTTLVTLPFAVILGMIAGYFGGWVDDLIQYIYTTISSIPGVLLIAAAILSIQVYIATHPDAFPTVASRADTRLLALCIILGLTTWTSLCRLIRAETLKLREMDYILAARVLGRHWFAILIQHIVPNLLHIILITITLDFSGLVLAEAVLTYVGVGVDPTTMSWGNMIDSARFELAREPAVWWPLLAAFVFMFMFILSANLFADKLRDALDPRSHYD